MQPWQALRRHDAIGLWPGGPNGAQEWGQANPVPRAGLALLHLDAVTIDMIPAHAKSIPDPNGRRCDIMAEVSILPVAKRLQIVMGIVPRIHSTD